MVVKGSGHFRFIVTHSGKVRGRSRREFELAQSDAKSHAARVAYDRKRKQDGPPYQQDDVKQDSEWTKQVILIDQDAFFVDTGFLDPFLRLANVISLEERNLLHEYLTLVPAAVYHTNNRSAFCPVRDVTLVAMSTNEIMLKWVILVMQHRRLKLMQKDPDKDTSFLHRRGQAYELMNKKLLDTAEAITTDDVVYGIVSSGVAEYRLDREEIGRQHIAAGLLMWKMRRKTKPKWRSKTLVYLSSCEAFIGIGVSNLFDSYKTLNASYSATIDRLKAIQSWNRDMRCLASGSMDTVAEDAYLVKKGLPSTSYVDARKQETRQHSILRLSIDKMLQETTTRGIRICLGALFALNTILWACRYNERIAIEFLNKFNHYLHKREQGDGKDQPQPAPLAVIFIIYLCSTELQEQYASHHPTLFDLWDAITFVDLIMLAGKRSRAIVRDAMVSWLLASLDQPGELCWWDDIDREAMMSEVQVAWREKQEQRADSGNTKQ